MGSLVNPFKIGKTYTPENFIDRIERKNIVICAMQLRVGTMLWLLVHEGLARHGFCKSS